jgi:hypothetical protein
VYLERPPVLIYNSLAVIENKTLKPSTHAELAIHLLRQLDCRLLISRVNISAMLQNGLWLPYPRFKNV